MDCSNENATKAASALDRGAPVDASRALFACLSRSGESDVQEPFMGNVMSKIDRDGILGLQLEYSANGFLRGFSIYDKRDGLRR